MINKMELLDKVNEMTGWDTKARRFHVFTDTTDLMRIIRGNVVYIGGKYYIVKGNMHESRFGIDETPKYWVFDTIEMETGDRKILKTVFDEEFYAHISILKIRCYRNPDKESKVLNITRNDCRFMQGYTRLDEKGNNVRIIDYIKGNTLFNYIPSIKKTHEEYFYSDLGTILWKLLHSILAIQFLHLNGLCHGDIRNDHIIIEKDTGRYRWIDFDLNQDVTDFDLWSIGNLLVYAVGKGIITFDNILKNKNIPDNIKRSLTRDDCSAFYNYRIMNLQKVFPYIPDKLGNLLRHFTIRPVGFLSDIKEFIRLYVDMLETVFPKSSLEDKDDVCMD
jgi:tRNA A-37 threonylcarbamoyl transferase component Bud32